MKIILCLKCTSVFNLAHTTKQCACGVSGGKYVDDLNAVMWGDRNSTIPIGFANSQLGDAIRDQRQWGDLPKTMYYGGQLVSPGRDFTAFVMANETSSVKWLPMDDDIFK